MDIGEANESGNTEVQTAIRCIAVQELEAIERELRQLGVT